MKRFDVGGAILAITPGVFLLSNATDNPTYYDKDNNESTSFDFWLSGFTVTVDAACKFEVGLAKSDRTGFVPYATTYGTKAVAGGIVYRFDQDRPKMTTTDALVNKFAVRITVPSDATVHAAGDIQFGRV